MLADLRDPEVISAEEFEREKAKDPIPTQHHPGSRAAHRRSAPRRCSTGWTPGSSGSSR